MEKQAITSQLTQSEIKKLKSLHTKKGRKRENLFMAEGIRLLEESLKFECKPQKVCFAPSLITPRAKKLTDSFRKLSVPIRAITAKSINHISDAKTSQGVLGLFDIPDYSGKRLFDKSRYILLLDNISDQGL